MGGSSFDLMHDIIHGRCLDDGSGQTNEPCLSHHENADRLYDGDFGCFVHKIVRRDQHDLPAVQFQRVESAGVRSHLVGAGMIGPLIFDAEFDVGVRDVDKSMSSVIEDDLMVDDGLAEFIAHHQYVDLRFGRGIGIVRQKRSYAHAFAPTLESSGIRGVLHDLIDRGDSTSFIATCERSRDDGQALFATVSCHLRPCHCRFGDGEIPAGYILGEELAIPGMCDGIVESAAFPLVRENDMRLMREYETVVGSFRSPIFHCGAMGEHGRDVH